MNNLPRAKLSPRLENGAIKWYQGDTFKLTLSLTLNDQDGEPVALSGTDTAEVIIRDSAGRDIKHFEFVNISSGSITLNFDTAATALFSAGRYMYDVHILHEYRTTICNDNLIVVE